MIHLAAPQTAAQQNAAVLQKGPKRLKQLHNLKGWWWQEEEEDGPFCRQVFPFFSALVLLDWSFEYLDWSIDYLDWSFEHLDYPN